MTPDSVQHTVILREARMNERDLGAWIAAELTRLDARHEPPWRDAPEDKTSSEEQDR